MSKHVMLIDGKEVDSNSCTVYCNTEIPLGEQKRIERALKSVTKTHTIIINAKGLNAEYITMSIE